MACRSPDLLRLRDGDADPRLVRAGGDRLGAAPDAVRGIAVRGHLDRADVRRGGRQDRPSQPALCHARRLCGARRHPDGRRVCRRVDAAARVHHRRAQRPGPPIGPRRAHRAGCRQHPERSAGGRHGHLAHHLGLRPRRRRAGGRRPVRGVRHGARLCRGGELLRARPAIHTRHFSSPFSAARSRCRAVRLPAPVGLARSRRRARLRVVEAAAARRHVDRLPRQHDGLSAIRTGCCPTSPRTSTASIRPGSATWSPASPSAPCWGPWRSACGAATGRLA